MDSDSGVDIKPVIDSSVEPSVQSDDPKPVEDTEKSDESQQQSSDQKNTEIEPRVSGDKEPEPSDEKMEVESSAVETPAVDEPKPADSPAAEEPAVEEQIKGVEPSVEPVPEVAVKSPSDASLNMVSSPTPAVQPSSTPPRSQNAKKPKVDLTTVPVRQYLDTTVVPILLQGLSALARERPAKPIAYLAQYLTDKASEYDE